MQSPGVACDECRRRKARCDRSRPQCGGCAESGTLCVINEKRPQRGPKKGQLQALRRRIVTLERQLEDRHEQHHVATMTDITADGDKMEWDHNFGAHGSESRSSTQSVEPPAEKVPDLPGAAGETPVDQAPELPNLPSFLNLDSPTISTDPLSAVFMDWNATESMARCGQFDTTALVSPGDSSFSTLMQADLDQLYFDRVHDVAPIVHKQRYLAWHTQSNPPPSYAQECLRSAMHTAAAAASAQYYSSADLLYAETREMLERQCNGGEQYNFLSSGTGGGAMPTGKSIQIEHIQAWLLLAHYEFLRKDEHQPMITTGRAFRLIQLARLHEVDYESSPAMGFPTELMGDAAAAGNANPPEVPEETFAMAEERRRVFWLAYCFDRFLSVRSEWPLTLHEEMIHTQLPAPETDFQNSHPIRMGFLSDMLDSGGGASNLSPFTECILLATLFGRCMMHRRLVAAGRLSSNGGRSRGLWARHEMLAAAVEERREAIAQMFHSSGAGSQNGKSATSAVGGLALSSIDVNPMLFFTHLLAQSATIYISIMTEMTAWQTVEQQFTASVYEQRAIRAAQEAAQLGKMIPRLGCFKAHPFVPSVLFRAARFLIDHPTAGLVISGDEGVDDGVGAVIKALHNLVDVNKLARVLMKELESRQASLASTYKY